MKKAMIMILFFSLILGLAACSDTSDNPTHEAAKEHSANILNNDGGGGTLSTNPDDNAKVEFSIFAHTDIVSAIKNDIPEVSDGWTDADNPVINYEHIVSIYTPENFSQNDSTFSDTLAFSNRYIAPAISDGKCIGAFFISQYEGKWVIDTYIAGLDIEAAIQQHKDTTLCFVSIPQFGVEEGFLTKTDTGEVYTSISATFDEISSGEELLNRLLEKNNQNNGEMTEG